MSKKGVIISFLQNYGENEQFLSKIWLLLLAAMLDDLGSSSNMAPKKQNTFQDSKKSAYCPKLKLNSRTCKNFFIGHVTVTIIVFFTWSM